ncbi:MAG: hypothetical protein ACP5I8_14060 [Phycisphaerae bacterium]
MPRYRNTDSGHGQPLVRPHQAVGESARVEALTGKITAESLLRGNELVILMIRPSLWYIAAGSFRFCGIVILLGILATHTGVFGDLLQPKTIAIITAGLVGVRVTYSLIEWTSHLYLLTTCRIVTIKGARHPTIFEAGLAHISEARLIQSGVQNLLGLGTIGFAAGVAIDPVSLWEWIPYSHRVHQQIQAAINKRKGM